jgi:hypothetical protein
MIPSEADSVGRDEIERVDDHETSAINYRGNMG